jgi:hypothetical protein
MSYRRSLSCLTIAMLLAATFAVPTAMAMPIDPTSGTEDTSTTPSAQQDRRGESAAERSSAPAARPTPHPRAIPPTWPMNPAPINPTPAQPVSTGDGGGSDDFPVVLVAVIGGVLVLCGGMALTAMRVRARHAH